MTTKNLCECADPGCPACLGRCKENAALMLYRIDMGFACLAMCDGCASDAMNSGLFTSDDWEAE